MLVKKPAPRGGAAVRPGEQVPLMPAEEDAMASPTEADADAAPTFMNVLEASDLKPVGLPALTSAAAPARVQEGVHGMNHARPATATPAAATAAAATAAGAAPAIGTADVVPTTPEEHQSWFSWLFGVSSPAPATTPTPPAAQVPTASSAAEAYQSVAASMMQGWTKQDVNRTARWARQEQEHNIAIQDPWSQREQEDMEQVDQIRAEDASERERAKIIDRLPSLSNEEIEEHRGIKASNFWASLETEDTDMERTLKQSDDLVGYARLLDAQNKRVAKASTELGSEEFALHSAQTRARHHEGTPFETSAISEPWSRLEAADKSEVEKLRHVPELQMLQLDHVRKHQ